MENIKLTLETSYEKYGNSSGMQIDTLSMAVFAQDYDGIYSNSLEYVDQYEDYALDNYDYEAEFLAHLDKVQAAIYVDDQESYKADLTTFTEELKEKARMHDLDESHPLAKALEEARASAEDDLTREWLYGDRSSQGMLADAGRRYGVDFHYDQKTDVLTFDIEAGELTDMMDNHEIEETPEAVAAVIANRIEIDAYHEHEKAKARREENRKNWETRKCIQAEREAEAEARRVAKLKTII